MNLLDKLCAVPAFVIGVILLILGVFGLFTGCKANFVLPPVLGVIPAIVGWGIVRSIWLAWRGPKPGREPHVPYLAAYDPGVIDARNELDKGLFGERNEQR